MAKTILPLEWRTEKRKVNDLVPLDINPRKISEAKRMKLIESLQRFDLVDIPVVDFDGTVISGHQRLRALQAMGRGEEMIDVRLPNRKLSSKEVKDYNVLANSHFGEWDSEIFDEHFSDVDLSGLGVDLVFEFPGGDLDASPEHAAPEAERLEAQEDDFEEPETVETDIVLGDLFEFVSSDGLLRHRLLCGDSTLRGDVERLMNGKKANVLFTDPPWNVAIGKNSNPKHRQREGLQNDDLPHALFKEFVFAFAREIPKILNGSAYVVLGASEWGTLDVALRECGMHWSATIIWVKQAFVLGRSIYHRQYEPIWFGWPNSGNSNFRGGRNKSDIWFFDRPIKSEYHPTMKPVKLVAEAISNSSELSGLALDLFLGSGTTMVAAHQLRRNCYGMEISPHYCQVIVDRLLRLDPTLTVLRNGETYHQPAAPEHE